METLAAVVLAAGVGKRMGGTIPKVLLEAGGRPLVAWVLDTLRSLGAGPIVIVEGPASPRVSDAVAGPDLAFVTQHDRRGTGHAFMQAEPALAAHRGAMLVVNGDMPLVSSASLRSLLAARQRTGAYGALLVARASLPGLGRVFVDASGHVERMIEARDLAANPDWDRPDAAPLVNVGAYLFGPTHVWDALRHVGHDNAQGEYYLPDVVEILRAADHRCAIAHAASPREALGVNTRDELAAVEAELETRSV